MACSRHSSKARRRPSDDTEDTDVTDDTYDDAEPTDEAVEPRRALLRAFRRPLDLRLVALPPSESSSEDIAEDTLAVVSL